MYGFNFWGLVLFCSLFLVIIIIVYWLKHMRKIPGYRRNRPDPNYNGPEQRQCNAGKCPKSEIKKVQ